MQIQRKFSLLIFLLYIAQEKSATCVILTLKMKTRSFRCRFLTRSFLETPVSTIQMSQGGVQMRPAPPGTNQMHVNMAQSSGQMQQPRGPPPPRPTPAQMLDLYYTSLCQPAFPAYGENPTNPLGMYPSNYYLDQYQQLMLEGGKPPY